MKVRLKLKVYPMTVLFMLIAVVLAFTVSPWWLALLVIRFDETPLTR